MSDSGVKNRVLLIEGSYYLSPLEDRQYPFGLMIYFLTLTETLGFFFYCFYYEKDSTPNLPEWEPVELHYNKNVFFIHFIQLMLKGKGESELLCKTYSKVYTVEIRKIIDVRQGINVPI